MRFLSRSLVGLFLFAATVGLLALAGAMVWGALAAQWAQEPQERERNVPVRSVEVVTVTPETATPVLRTYGQVRTRRTLEVRAAAAGEIVELAEAFEEGGRVAAGEVIARIDPADADSALRSARTDVADAEAELAEARRAVGLAEDDLVAAEDQASLRDRALSRQQDLADRGVGTAAATEEAELAAAAARQSVLSRRSALAQAEARVSAAETDLDRRNIALDEAERTLEDTEVTAAFDGVLADVAVVEGRRVTAGERLAELIDADALEVAFTLSTAQYARLLTDAGRLPEAEVTVGLDVGGVAITAQGVVTRESGSVAEGQTGRRLFARLEAAPGFRPGDFVSVAIEEPPLTGVARLPAAALDSATTVLAVTDDDRLEVRQADLMRRQGDDVLVAAGDLAGRQVVAERTPLLGAGLRVAPTERAPPEAAAPSPETVALAPEERDRLMAFVRADGDLAAEARERMLSQLRADRVPAAMVADLQSRMGG